MTQFKLHHGAGRAPAIPKWVRAVCRSRSGAVKLRVNRAIASSSQEKVVWDCWVIRNSSSFVPSVTRRAPQPIHFLCGMLRAAG